MKILRDDRGTLVIWVLGLCVGILFLGGLSLDVWRAFAERRVLAGMADGAVIAGATAIDETAWRTTGLLALDPADAADRADAYLTGHPAWDPAITPTITSGPAGIEVTLERDVEFTLLRILIDDGSEFEVSVDAFCCAGGLAMSDFARWAPVLDVPGVADLLGISIEESRRLVGEGWIASTEVGGSVLIRRDDVIAFLRSRRIVPPGEGPETVG